MVRFYKGWEIDLVDTGGTCPNTYWVITKGINRLLLKGNMSFENVKRVIDNLEDTSNISFTITIPIGYGKPQKAVIDILYDLIDLLREKGILTEEEVKKVKGEEVDQ